MRFLRSRSVLFFALCAVSLFGCGRKSVSTQSVIPLVDDIIMGRNLDLRPIVEAYDPASAEGDIVIFGDAVDVMPLSRYMEKYDRYDNINGRVRKDRLPDLSGEVITRIAAMPKVLSSEDYVREVLLCLDTVSVRSQSNGVSLRHRNPAKLVVMTATDAAVFGKRDVDSLFRAFNAESPAVFPMALVAEKIASKGLKSEKTVVVTSRVDTLYSAWFENYFVADKGVLAVSDSLDRIADLSVRTIVLDDYTIDADAVRADHPGVEVFSAKEEAASFCYLALRRRNAFTHRIFYPKFDSYVALPDGDGNYLIVESNGRYIQD